MGASLSSRMMLAVAWIILSLLGWESAVAWSRYEPAGGDLGGFLLTATGVRPREPGVPSGASGPEVAADWFRGARYDVLQPMVLAPVLGTQPRYRLVGLMLADPEKPGAPSLEPWGGGQDPLARFLRITSLLTGWLVHYRSLEVAAGAMELGVELRLVEERLVAAAR